MAPRKRGRDEMESSEPPTETSLLRKIRNMWEFACVMQYIFTFGKVVKINEDFDIEEFENECLKPQPSEKLEEIGLTLLKWISSHRGLTLENWNEYTRRQYVSKAPHLNPYGTEEQPSKFRDFDILQRIRILHQLTVWTFWNPDRLRERMPEQKETDQTLWRVEELGWDREERSYYVLDDSRLYRRTEPPLPAAPKAKSKSNTLKAQAARRRASKRRRLEVSETPEANDGEDNVPARTRDGEDTANGNQQVDTFGAFKWECVAVTSEQYQEFLRSIEKSRDLNEKDLHLRIVEQVLPVVEKAEESHRRKMERKQRELLNMQRLSGAKRSGRLADKHERERQEREAIEAAEKRAAELAAAHKEQQRQSKMEQDRQSRMMTREQRIKDREYKRLLHEEELAKMAEEAKRVEAGEARASERHLKAQIEKHKRDLEDLSATEDWVFDCSGCGVYGKNIDDGAHSVACERCNVWQHSKCLGIRQVEAEKDDFHFVCKDCRQKTEDAKRPNIKIKFRAGLSASPPQVKGQHAAEEPSPTLKFKAVEIPALQPQNSRSASQDQYANLPVSSPRKVANGVVPSPYLQHAASSASSNHSAHQSGISPQTRPPPSSVYLNGSPQSQTMYSYPSSPRHRQSPLTSSYTNGHASNVFPTSPQHLQGSRPASRPSSGYINKQYPNYPALQSQSVSQLPHPSLHSTPQTRAIPDQTLSGGAATPNNQTQGRLPSPVINRPSMSPTQGNPDVGPVAGVPQRNSTGNSMSSPLSHSPVLHHQNKHDAALQNHAYQSTPYTNGNPNSHQTHSNVNNPPNSNQPQHLSGLSPTKHSSAPFTSQNHSSSPHIPPATTARSVSGTLIFPPSEMLQPSPKQLSKSPVPTPSKAMTPATVGKGELERVSDQIRDRVEERTSCGS